jgi:uncharacterized delta-60 repeat protein
MTIRTLGLVETHHSYPMQRIPTLFSFLFAAGILCAQPGTLDQSFGNGGITGLNMPDVIHEFKATAVQADGRIVCVGYMGVNAQEDLLLVRFLNDGTLDASFGTGGIQTTDVLASESFWSVALQPDGKIVAAGITYTAANAQLIIARYNANGTPDATFATSGRQVFDIGDAQEQLTAVAVQPDGKIVATGFVLAAANDVDMVVVRLNANGSFDTGFSGDGWTTLSYGTDCAAWGLAVQADGRIVTAGYANPNGAYVGLLARFMPNGAPDLSFNATGAVLFAYNAGSSQDEFWDVVIQPDQKLVAIGSTFEPEGDLLFTRFSSTGALDTDYGTGGSQVIDVAGTFDRSWSGYQQPDGKLVVAGLNQLTAGNRQVVVARLGTNGSRDAGFGTNGIATVDVGPANDAGLGCAMAADGDVLVTGYTENNSGYNAYLLRLQGAVEVGLKERTMAPTLTAYPSPFTDRLVVKVADHMGPPPTLHVRDMLGRSVPVHVQRAAVGEGTFQLSVVFPLESEAGIYFIEVPSQGKNAVVRVVKE